MAADDDDLQDLKARLLELNRAHGEAVRAWGLLAEAQGSAMGLAKARVARATAALDQATFRLTGGRPLHEALWSIADEI